MGELSSIGVNYSQSIVFEESNAYRRYGTCIKQSSRHKDYDFTIRINKWIDESDIKNIKSVIVHELLHTVNFQANHTGEWKTLSEFVNEKLGYDIERTTSIKLNYPNNILKEYICPECKAVFQIKKRSRRIYYCKKCNVRIRSL